MSFHESKDRNHQMERNKNGKNADWYIYMLPNITTEWIVEIIPTCY